MRMKEVSGEFRAKINEYLSEQYGVIMSSDTKHVTEERNHYLYFDVENNDCFYIPKDEIDF